MGSSWFFVDNCNLRVGSCGFFFLYSSRFKWVLVVCTRFLCILISSSGFLCVLVGFL